MSSSKSELPTEKKKRDSAKKGQSFKSRDLTVVVLLLSGLAFLLSLLPLGEVMALFRSAVEGGFRQDIRQYSLQMLWLALKLILPLMLVCVLASALTTLLQTRFVLASEAVKINFDALNPVNGFKKLFSLRTVKDTVKAMLYLGVFSLAVLLFWHGNKAALLAQVHASLPELLALWPMLLRNLVVTCIACVVPVMVLDALAEYFLVIKDMKMEKQEVKREHKEQDGSPEMKGRLRELREELLSEQQKTDIENSRMIIANPSHIAIGIYFNPEVVPIPFISVLETNQRALAVRRYAERVGVPVVHDIALARRMYRKHKRYTFIQEDAIGEVLALLMWLEQAEHAGMLEHPERMAANAALADDGYLPESSDPHRL